MIDYNKDKIKEEIDIQDIFELLIEFKADPEWMGDSTIVCNTICHHHPNEDMSRKLYYYDNSKLFQCWTNCGGFDVFELVRKIMTIQNHQDYDLNMAVRWTANRFGINGDTVDKNDLEDWDIMQRYSNLSDQVIQQIKLQEYDNTILDRFNYTLKLTPWLNDGISQEVLDYAHIGFYPGGDQITIPHYDSDGRLVGIRGRTVCKDEAEKYGKYRPLKINNVLYTHPLGVNLYNLNNSKNNIKTMGKAIIVESEKGCLQYATMFGIENDITVATCGSNLSAQQVELLLKLGVQEIIICFDRQFQQRGDKEFELWIKKLKKINDKFKNEVLVSFMFDKWDLLKYKSSPTDEGKEKFLTLYQNRIII